MEIFKVDSEVMEAINRITDYIVLNLLCFLFSLPIITLGAAFTAKNYTAMKLVSGQEPHIWKSFTKSFKENFKQATQVWLCFLVIFAVLGWDWYSVLYGKSKDMLLIGKAVLFILTYLSWSVLYCFFPFLARFKGTTKELLKGAAVMSLLKFPQMFLIFVVTFIPYIIEAWYIKWALFIWIFCTTVTLYYVSKMMHEELSRLEGGLEHE